MNFNKKEINEFKAIIEAIVDTRLDNRRITNYVAAIVVDKDNDGYISVVIPPESTKITKLLNKTGEILQAGDSVEIATKNGILSNAWVAIKHSTNNQGGYPIDSIYIHAVNVNPSIFFGGTWSACGTAALGTITGYVWRRIA